MTAGIPTGTVVTPDNRMRVAYLSVEGISEGMLAAGQTGVVYTAQREYIHFARSTPMTCNLTSSAATYQNNNIVKLILHNILPFPTLWRWVVVKTRHFNFIHNIS